MRSDALFPVINFVLERFVEPFLQIFRYTANLLFTSLPPASDANVMAEAQTVLLSLFHDLKCQGTPPAFEDSHAEAGGEFGVGGECDQARRRCR